MTPTASSRAGPSDAVGPATSSGSGSGSNAASTSTSTTSTSVTSTIPTPETFPFPYAQPYAIQLDLMRTVFRAIESGKVAIVESPTGTGKSLTLLTSTLTWLGAHEKRLEHDIEASLRAKFLAEDSDDPPWVIEHAVKAELAEMRAAQEMRQERLDAAREKERKMRAEPARKRIKIAIETDGVERGNSGKRKGKGKEDGDESDDEFLPDDAGEDEGGKMNLSKEVRELMAKFDQSRGRVETGDEIDVPKVFYTSRTHTQLRQLTTELLKTEFAGQGGGSGSEGEGGGTSAVPLGGRKQMCINDKVRALGENRLNEACLDMQKGKQKCPYLPDEVGLLDARDTILATVKDIEDIVADGRKSGVCPYYATRKAVKQAQLVTLPYNLLLQKNAREALGIDLTGHVVVIDEAHNLIDTLLSIHSTAITSTNISNAIGQLTKYLARFKSRLRPTHALWIRQTLALLQGLLRVCTSFASNPTKPGNTSSTSSSSKSLPSNAQSPAGSGTSELVDVNTLMTRVGGGSDQINLVHLVSYLKESKLARKVSSYTEKSDEATFTLNTTDTKFKNSSRVIGGAGAGIGSNSSPSSAAKHASIAAFHTIEAFILSLTDARDDGRVIITREGKNETGDPVVSMRYVLLNPAERFREVVEQARSVVLAGGTMEPVSDFFRQLFPAIPRDRFETLSCAHVIPKSNLLVQVISRGPRKVGLEFKYTNRNDEGVLGELGAVIQSTIGLVPDGVVVFLPSYAFLDKVKTAWTSSGLLSKFALKKQLFYEPQTSGGVEATLRDYAMAIGPGKPGALLFAVVGGKLSEGINFSDSLGRCVVMVGLPFANVGSTELQERMKYVSGLPGAGADAAKEMYENLCMRAVNQSIGRAIRHAGDYATILLVDKRYSSARIRNKLPKWIGEDVRTPEDWTAAARGVAAFFRAKRDLLGQK